MSSATRSSRTSTSRRYFDAYYLIALVLPVLVLVFYHLLAWRGPLRKAREPRAIRPVEMAGDGAGSALPSLGSGVARADVYRYLARAARLVLPAATVALEVSSVRAPGRGGADQGGMGGGHRVPGRGGLCLCPRRPDPRLEQRRGPRRSPRQGPACGGDREIGCGALRRALAPGGVARHECDGGFRSPRRPLPLAPGLARGRCDHSRPRALVLSPARAFPVVARRDLHRDVILTLIVGPILLFLCVASLPGAFGSFNGFDDGQGLAAAQLTFHGFFPGRTCSSSTDFSPTSSIPESAWRCSPTAAGVRTQDRACSCPRRRSWCSITSRPTSPAEIACSSSACPWPWSSGCSASSRIASASLPYCSCSSTPCCVAGAGSGAACLHGGAGHRVHHRPRDRALGHRAPRHAGGLRVVPSCARASDRAAFFRTFGAWCSDWVSLSSGSSSSPWPVPCPGSSTTTGSSGPGTRCRGPCRRSGRSCINLR